MGLLGKIAHKNFALMGKMLDLYSAQQRVISQNIANVNTPNYRRRELKFDGALRDAMLKGSAADYRDIKGWVDRPRVTPVRNNGNNVDIDLEMTLMKENAMKYEMLTNILPKRMEAYSKAINGGR